MASHNDARFTFKSSAAGTDPLDVVDFVGEEALSKPFWFIVNLVSDSPDVKLEDVINQPATLGFERGDDASEIHGIVADFQAGRQVEINLGYRYLYRATLVPRLHRLGLSYQSRIFQHLTVQEIVKQVLQESGMASSDFEFSLDGSYSPREYCTQYQETDLAFVQRLLEFEGIRYFFTHDDGKDLLVLTDRADRAPERGDALDFRVAEGLAAADSSESVREFSSRQQIVTGKVVLKDYNYRTPETLIKSESQLNGDMPGVFYDYGTHIPTPGESDRLAKVRNEEIESQREVMTGTSNALALRAGSKFKLQNHYRDALNQSYLLTHIRHEGRQPDAAPYLQGGSLGPDYQNHFVGIPATAPYRPPRLTPEPKLPGIMTALVESGGGDYAYLDDQGRYRIKVPFDLSDASDGGASKPIRLAQPYSGPGYGHHFPVHKGAEMVFACVNGHVDRPLGLGTVPNPSQASPVTSANAPQNRILTWGENELTMDDTQGSENIYLHATKDHTVEITNDETIHVGHDRAKKVDHDEALEVGHDQDERVRNNQTLDVGVNQSLTIGSNRSMSVGANLDETVGASMTVTVGANRSESIGGSMDQTIAIAKSETVGAAASLSVGAVLTVSVGAASSEAVGGVKTLDVGSNYSQTVGGAASLTAAKDASTTAGDNVKVQSGKDSSLQAGKNVSLKAGKKMTLEATDELVLKCGSASIILKKSGDVTIDGKKVTVKGSGDLILKGSKIAAN